ncbi:hypothetical protein [Blastococcus deserti]|uniref:Uncharacterized protein n=1 Tax=Blastococcus deserti TaxID=2259033 RepID=A0ABW4X894_9ACTN
MSVGLPVPAGASDPDVVADGTVVYSGGDRASTDVAVQPLVDGSIRATVALEDDSAPASYSFPLTLPEDVVAVPAEDGGVDFVKTDTPTEGTVQELTLGHVDPAWAVDGNGQPVPSSYELVDGALVQHIELDEATAFPVVADPRWTWGWTTGTVYFNKYETQGVAGGAISLVGVFSFAPPPFNVVALWYTGNIIGWASSAMWQRKCLKVQYGFTWSWKGATPGVTPGHYTGGYCR